MSFGVRYSPTINKQSFIASETTGKFGRLNSGFTIGTKYAPSISEQSYIMNMIQEYGGGGSTGSTGSSSIEDIHIVNQEVLGLTGKVDSIPNVSPTLKAYIKTSDVLSEINGPLSNGSIYTFGKSKPSRIVCIGEQNTSAPVSGSISYSDDNGVSWTNIAPYLFGFGKCVIWTGQIWLAGINVNFSDQQKYSLGWSVDGTTWFPNFSEDTSPIFSISCNGISCLKNQDFNILRAVGQGSINTIATSYDGIIWTGGGNTIFSISGNGIASNGNTIVAVGSGTNTIAYATLTSEFTGIVTSVFSSSGNGIAWNGNMWVAVGSGINTIAYSYDGTVWTGADSTTNIFNGGAGLTIAWNGNIWVAGGGAGSQTTLAYSRDGVNWTGISNTIFTGSSSYCRSITWYNGSGPYKFIAVGSWENTQDNTKPFGIATSEDGINWNPTYAATFNCYGVASNSSRQNTVTISSNLNIAVGEGTNTIAYSEDDGITWTGIGNPSPILFSIAYSVLFNGKMWVVGGAGNNTIAYSRDGIIWTGISNDSINNPFKDGSCYGLAWNGKRFVGVGHNDPITYTIATSEDGICWIGVEDSINIFNQASGVAWNGKRFVAVGAGANTIAYSEDGKIWTGVINSTTIFSQVGIAVAWNGQKWVAVGAGANTIAYSDDGTIWTGLGDSIFSPGSEVAWNGEVWVAVGEGLITIAYSYDGTIWTGVTDSKTILDIGYGISWTGNRFVAVGNDTNNSIVWSKDGINNWTGVSNSTSIFSTGYRVAWSGLKNSIYIKQPIVMGGIGDNQLIYSEEGINWVGNTGTSIFGTGGGCISICWNGNIWVVGGGPNSSNTMAYSYDGKSWTGLGNSIFSQTSNTGICASISWNGTMFVAGGSSLDEYSIVWSDDGKSWTGVADSLAHIQVATTISWNGKMWIAGGFTSGSPQLGKIATSIDGKIWTYYDITTVLNGILSIAWNGLLWVAVGGNEDANNSIAYSENGTVWTGVASSTNFFSDGGASVAWNGQRFVAVGSGSSNNVAWSDDGTIWTGLGTSFFDVNSPNVVSWVGNKWMMGSKDIATYYSSIDGIHWNEIPIGKFDTIPPTDLITGVFAIASNSLVGPVVVDNQIVINPGESLDVVSDTYYNTGYTNMSMSMSITANL